MKRLTKYKAMIRYNIAEKKVKQNFSDQSYVERANSIYELLEKHYGRDIADDILELIFANDFTEER